MTAGQTVRLTGPAQRNLGKRLVECAPQGAILNIREAKRTTDQNAKMHAMISDVARAKPEGRTHSPLVWKSLFMATAGFKPVFAEALDGEGVVPVGYKSSQLTKAEFSDLIEAIYEYGARHGVEWSEPHTPTGGSS